TALPAAAIRRPRPIGQRPRARRYTASSRCESSAARPAQELLRFEGLDLRVQVREIRPRIEWATRGPLHQLGRLERAPPAVDVLPQPLAQGAKLSAPELLVQVAQLARRPLPQLDPDHVPERIRREVAKARVRPVDVLQDAVDDVRRLDAEVLAELRVEGLGEVDGSHLAREHLPLQLEAKDDVERVGDLVGVDPANTRRDTVERTVELAQRHLRQTLRERLLEPRVEEAPRR